MFVAFYIFSMKTDSLMMRHLWYKAVTLWPLSAYQTLTVMLIASLLRFTFTRFKAPRDIWHFWPYIFQITIHTMATLLMECVIFELGGSVLVRNAYFEIAEIIWLSVATSPYSHLFEHLLWNGSVWGHKSWEGSGKKGSESERTYATMHVNAMCIYCI